MYREQTNNGSQWHHECFWQGQDSEFTWKHDTRTLNTRASCIYVHKYIEITTVLPGTWMSLICTKIVNLLEKPHKEFEHKSILCIGAQVHRHNNSSPRKICVKVSNFSRGSTYSRIKGQPISLLSNVKGTITIWGAQDISNMDKKIM